MYVGLDVLGTVGLDDPIDVREIQPAGGHICREQYRSGPPQKVEVQLSPGLLLHLAVQSHDRQAGAEGAEHPPYVSYLGATREEDDRLGLEVRLDEGENGVELVLEWNDDVTLLEVLGRHRLVLVVHSNVDGTGIQAERRQVRYLPRLCGREQHRLPLTPLALTLGQVVQYPFHLIPKSHIQYSIGLVQYQRRHVGHVQIRSLLQVLQQSAGGGH
mmetsp:Transcript_38559/g.115725  ORF Transcript_38559/g.115725 Transcript_38559/m.115725 type:complete len:215 (+) Transcript_38559:1320-1964(+)